MSPSPNEEFLTLLPGDDAERSGLGRVADALRWGEKRLRDSGIVGARLQATLLLGDAMGFDRAQLLARLRDPVPAAADAVYRQLVERRTEHVPLQYLRGSAPFLDFELEVRPGVFIPRPETEMVVERALLAWDPWDEGIAPPPDRDSQGAEPSPGPLPSEPPFGPHAAQPPFGAHPSGPPFGPHSAGLPFEQRTAELPFVPPLEAREGEGIWAVDVGTGSGAIAIALARRRPRARICAVERSRTALQTARRNAERLGVSDRVLFLEGDLLAALGAGGERPPEAVRRAVGMVVSNPPYAAEGDDVDPEVRLHEPHDAWAAGPTGLEVYTRLLPQAAALLLPGRPLVLELGYGQERPLRDMLADDHRWGPPTIEPDFQDIPRILVVHRR